MIKVNGKDYAMLLKGKGFRHKGEYSSSTIYYNTTQVIDCVFYCGTSYYCKRTTTAGIAPTNSEYWGVLASGDTTEADLFAESERQKSKNLFNPDNLIIGARSHSTGNYMHTANYLTNDKLIDVVPNSTITLSYKSNKTLNVHAFLLYNNGVFVSSVINSIVTIPDNVNQIGINFGVDEGYLHIGDVYDIQLEYGLVATEYQPYYGAIVHQKDLGRVLWKNSLPDGVFNPQYVTLASDDYDYLFITYRISENIKRSVILSKKEIVLKSTLKISAEHKESNGVVWQMAFLSRDFVFDSYTNMYFYGCEKTIQGGNNSVASNENMKLVEIIGIKVGV